MDRLPLDYEVIVVDDGSTDNTMEICSKMFMDNDRIKVIGYDENKGKGFALKHGFNNSKGRIVAFVDADSDISFDHIKRFLEELDKRECDIVIGSKYLPESSFNSPLSRRFLSRCYHLFVRFLLRVGVSDTQVGFKVFKRKVLEDVFPRVLVKRFAFDVELLTVSNMRGYSVSEVPVKVNHKDVKRSVDAWEILKMFIDTCAVFYRRYIVRHYERKP